MSIHRPKKLDKIKERFPGKQINRLVSFRYECPLSIFQRLTYSFLAYRCKRNGRNVAASVRQLSTLSGMHRDTVAKALRQLSSHDLVQRLGNKKWRVNKAGVETHPEWFGWRTNGRELKDIGYHYFPQPAATSPLSLIDALIYLADIFDPGKSAACLAGRFGISWNTVNKSRKNLSRLEYSRDWFKDIEFHTKKPQDKARWNFLQQFVGAEKLLVSKMMAIREPAWSQQDILRLLKIAKEQRPTSDGYDNLIYTLVGDGPNGFDAVMRVHHRMGSDKDCGLGLVLHRLGFVR